MRIHHRTDKEDDLYKSCHLYLPGDDGVLNHGGYNVSVQKKTAENKIHIMHVHVC
jgi:hypothetical protein